MRTVTEGHHQLVLVAHPAAGEEAGRAERQGPFSGPDAAEVGVWWRCEGRQ